MFKKPIPAGYHDSEGAAKLLGIPKRKLFEILREETWIHIGGDLNNLPRRELKANGWMSTLDGSYCLKGKKEIVKNSSKLLISQAGLQELKKIIDKKSLDEKTMEHTQTQKPEPQKAKAPVIKIEPPEKPFNKEAAEIERKKCLAELADLGIPNVSGWK